MWKWCDTIKISYGNNRIEKVCNDVEVMDKYFSHNKDLIEAFKVLMFIIETEERLDNFYIKEYLKGYNLEKLTNRVNYSLRIIPKKAKSKMRLIIFKINEVGDSIEIIEISDHYKK